MAERCLVDQEDEACRPLPLDTESGVNGRASRARFADAIEPVERGALWVFRRTGWLPFAFCAWPGRQALSAGGNADAGHDGAPCCLLAVCAAQ